MIRPPETALTQPKQEEALHGQSQPKEQLFSVSPKPEENGRKTGNGPVFLFVNRTKKDSEQVPETAPVSGSGWKQVPGAGQG